MAGAIVGVAALLALTLSPAALGEHDSPRRYAGEWKMTFFTPPGTGTLKLRAVSAAAGRAAQKPFQWGTWVNSWCAPLDKAQWYVGDFKTANDSGPTVGCASGASGSFYMVYKSLAFKVEGGLNFSGPGPARFGNFPSNPIGPQSTEFSVSFVRHFAGDGAGEEQPACGTRGLREAGGTQCTLDRVVFLEGTKYLQPAAKSKEAAVGQYVYFRAAVTGHTLPLELLLLFPKEVGKDGVTLAKENDMVGETKAEVDCPSSLSFNAKRGQHYLLCKVLSTARSGAIVRVEVPQALRGKRLEVVLAALRRTPGQSAPEVVSKATAGVDLTLTVSKPAAAPAAPENDPVEGRWEVVRVAGRLPAAFPETEVAITRGRDEKGALKQDLWVGKGGGVELFLNRPRDENRIYDGSATVDGATEPLQVQLITPGGSAIFPYCAIQGLEKETYLCGWWVHEPPCLACGTPIVKRGEKIVVLRRVGD